MFDQYCEICNKKFAVLDKHHIQSKSLNGSNKSFNIAHLCQNCHKTVHMGLIILEGRFRTTKGNKLIWRKFTDKSITELDDPPVYLVPNHEKYQKLYKIKNKLE